MSPADLIALWDGRVLAVHSQDHCGAGPFCIHNPSNHSLDTAPAPEPERCSERPEELELHPLRRYHCPTCGCTCLAGIPHEVTGHEPGCPYYEPTDTEPW